MSAPSRRVSNLSGRSIRNIVVLPALLGAIIAVGVGGLSWAKDDPKLRQAIEAANGQFIAAMARGDAASLAALYTDSGQVLPPGGEPLTGREALKTFWQGALDAGMKQAKLETVEVTEAGDLAFEIGRFWIYGADGRLMESGKDLVVWKRERGAWKFHRDIWNSSRPPAAN